MGADYSAMATPLDYRCSKCGSVGCKLWRGYLTFERYIDLLCAACAEADQLRFHEEGWRSLFALGGGNQIGQFFPAIPKEDGSSYWGYALVPPEGNEWWNRLPSESPRPKPS